MHSLDGERKIGAAEYIRDIGAHPLECVSSITVDACDRRIARSGENSNNREITTAGERYEGLVAGPLPVYVDTVGRMKSVVDPEMGILDGRLKKIEELPPLELDWDKDMLNMLARL